jgi:glycosyltransferase involved in cell wall biosynthesis
MKIGYFITHFLYENLDGVVRNHDVGGGRTAAYYLALNMALKGHEVAVFTTSVNSKSTVERYRNIKIYRYGTNFSLESGRFSLGLLKKPIKYPIDLIHVHVSVPMGDIAGLRYAKKKNIPLVVTYHNDLVGGFGSFIRQIGIYFYNKYLLDKVLSYADVIISPSECYINESSFLGKYRDKIVVIPNGIDLRKFDIPHSKDECREKLGLPLNDEIILFLGTLGPHKGPDILLKAMPKIIKEIPNTKLIFVGGGTMREELERLCKKMGVEKYVKFAGFVEEDLKPFYYRTADVFALPSTMRHESFGIVNLEAMACGVPIVASKIGGVPDVVKDKENGLLVPPKDSSALAEAIIYLLGNEDIREKMGKNERKRVGDYSWEMIAEETEKVYEGLI